ncbi:Tubulinyl-Tyr carboxypeptidase 1 [Boothiomyces sp. JEL0866]|nr:Tubulinyl-Tyr carboxypeptidase 1 [Boothiomyces sp. JEL0866]
MNIISEDRIIQAYSLLEKLINSHTECKETKEILDEMSWSPSLTDYPIPRPIVHSKTTSTLRRITSIQKYIEKLSYNFLGEPFFTIKKTFSINKICRLSQEMIQCGLPIKCLEAVALGIYLTMNFDVDRVPISFKSECDGNEYRHIVLGIKYGDRWGAIGLSRRLGNDPLTRFNGQADNVPFTF